MPRNPSSHPPLFVATYAASRDFLLPDSFDPELHAGLRQVDQMKRDDGSVLVLCAWESEVAHRNGEDAVRGELDLGAPASTGWLKTASPPLSPLRRRLRRLWKALSEPGQRWWSVLLACLAFVATCSTARDRLIEGFGLPDVAVAPDESDASVIRVAAGDDLQARFLVANRATLSASVITAEAGQPRVIGPASAWVSGLHATPETHWSPKIAPGTTHAFRVNGITAGPVPAWIESGRLELPVSVRGGAFRRARLAPESGPASIEVEIWPDLKIGPLVAARHRGQPGVERKRVLTVLIAASRPFQAPEFCLALPADVDDVNFVAIAYARDRSRHIEIQHLGPTAEWRLRGIQAFSLVEIEIFLEASGAKSPEQWASLMPRIEPAEFKRE